MASPKIDKNLIAKNIKNTRLESGLNQEDFGKLFTPHADKSIVSRWERGKSIPNAERLKTIAKKANMSVRYFTTGEKTYSDLTPDEIKVMKNETKKYMKKEIDKKNQELYDSLSNNKDVKNLSTLPNALLNDVIKLIQLVRDQDGESSLFSLDMIISTTINAKLNNHSDDEYQSLIEFNEQELAQFIIAIKESPINKIKNFDVTKLDKF